MKSDSDSGQFRISRLITATNFILLDKCIPKILKENGCQAAILKGSSPLDKQF